MTFPRASSSRSGAIRSEWSGARCDLRIRRSAGRPERHSDRPSAEHKAATIAMISAGMTCGSQMVSFARSDLRRSNWKSEHIRNTPARAARCRFFGVTTRGHDRFLADCVNGAAF